MSTVKQAIAPLLKNHRPVVARSFSQQTLKETILYLRTEIAGIKQVQSNLRIQMRKTKADGKPTAHLERVLKRQETELARFEARLADFKSRQAATDQKLLPAPTPAPKTVKQGTRRAVAKT